MGSALLILSFSQTMVLDDAKSSPYLLISLCFPPPVLAFTERHTFNFTEERNRFWFANLPDADTQVSRRLPTLLFFVYPSFSFFICGFEHRELAWRGRGGAWCAGAFASGTLSSSPCCDEWREVGLGGEDRRVLIPPARRVSPWGCGELGDVAGEGPVGGGCWTKPASAGLAECDGYV